MTTVVSRPMPRGRHDLGEPLAVDVVAGHRVVEVGVPVDLDRARDVPGVVEQDVLVGLEDDDPSGFPPSSWSASQSVETSRSGCVSRRNGLRGLQIGHATTIDRQVWGPMAGWRTVIGGGRLSAFSDMGKDSTDAAAKSRSALEQASAGPEDHGAFGNSVVRLIESILDTGIDGKGPFHSAQQVADVALSGHADVEQAVDASSPRTSSSPAAGGFATGLGGFITLPVALPANVVEFYLVATRMVAAVASAGQLQGGRDVLGADVAFAEILFLFSLLL